jgi:hypothetical protein
VDSAKPPALFAGTAGLSVAAFVALLLTALRKPVDDAAARERAVRLFLIGLAAQSLHFMEEFVTRFQDRFPALLSLPAWSNNFYVIFNLLWMCVWILSAVAWQKGSRLAFFPVSFFALASIANGIGHPVLAVLVHGYFPGLVTSPVVGIIGVLLFVRLLRLTRSP